MDSLSVGQQVSVASEGPTVDGIVFDMPSRNKVVVAVVSQSRGPSFLTVNPSALSQREVEGEHDAALRMLIRRTPQPTRGAARGASVGGRGTRGHTRGAAHRTTGR
jgi:hypothetical protein